MQYVPLSAVTATSTTHVASRLKGRFPTGVPAGFSVRDQGRLISAHVDRCKPAKSPRIHIPIAVAARRPSAVRSYAEGPHAPASNAARPSRQSRGVPRRLTLHIRFSPALITGRTDRSNDRRTQAASIQHRVVAARRTPRRRPPPHSLPGEFWETCPLGRCGPTRKTEIPESATLLEPARD